MTTRTVAEAITMASEHLLKHSIPLYSEDRNGRPYLRGTGFVVAANGRCYLVTAAHVLDIARSECLFYFAGPRQVCPLREPMVLSKGVPDRDHDTVDVGVVVIPKGALPPHPAVDKFPMALTNLRSRHLPRSGKEYVLIGYPASRASSHRERREAMVGPCAFLLRSVDDEAYSDYGLDPRRHVGLSLKLGKGFDLDGHRQHFPRPQGMSGSPIVVLYDERGENDAAVFPVVGVATRFLEPQRLLVGTDISQVIDAIARLA